MTEDLRNVFPRFLARALATQAQLPWLWRQSLFFVSPCIRSLSIISWNFTNLLLTGVLVASRIWNFTRSICLCRSAAFCHRHGSRWPGANGRRSSWGGQAWSAPGVRRIQSWVSEDLLRYVMMLLVFFVSLYIVYSVRCLDSATTVGYDGTGSFVLPLPIESLRAVFLRKSSYDMISACQKIHKYVKILMCVILLPQWTFSSGVGALWFCISCYAYNFNNFLCVVMVYAWRWFFNWNEEQPLGMPKWVWPWRTDIECSAFEPPYAPKKLLYMEGVVCKTTNSWSKVMLN